MTAPFAIAIPGKPYEGASPDPYWFSTIAPRAADAALATDITCDLAIIGGGFTGLWSALKARERMPDARIVVLEGGRCGGEASGRNGGFCAPSISHGISNAMERYPREADRLIRLGVENVEALEADLERYEIDAEFQRAGKLNVAATPWQVQGLRSMAEGFAAHGLPSAFLEGDALRAKLDSPVYSAGVFDPTYALVNPSKLVEGLRAACLARGVEIHEGTRVTALKKTKTVLRLTTPGGMVTTARAIMATNAAEPLLKRFRTAIIPIFDYSLVTQPLSAAQLASIGWTGPHGIADSGNQFHYLRKTADNRILWAGYDAIYHKGSGRDAEMYHREESFDRLAAQFAQAFPSLADVRFDYAWGGIIDTSARITFFTGTALGGRLAYALGFTGQGVSATRFAAGAMLDQLEGKKTEASELSMHRRFPVPFPPEPLRSIAVRMAQKGLAHEDRTGQRPLMLRVLDRFGVGFDS